MQQNEMQYTMRLVSVSVAFEYLVTKYKIISLKQLRIFQNQAVAGLLSSTLTSLIPTPQYQ